MKGRRCVGEGKGGALVKGRKCVGEGGVLVREVCW